MPDRERLRAVIAAPTQIARLGMDLGAVMAPATERALLVETADKARYAVKRMRKNRRA